MLIFQALLIPGIYHNHFPYPVVVKVGNKNIARCVTQIPSGVLNCAAVPEPSAKPATLALPARAYKIFAAVNSTTRPDSSVIKKLPCASIAIAAGLPNKVACPGPPAMVVTTPAGVISLIALLPRSATKILPFASKTSPAGALNEA